MKRIHESLKDIFQHHRLVFWYDGEGEWGKAFETFEDDGVEKLEIARNEFGLKFRMLGKDRHSAKFLAYSPSPRPPDTENWLLDLLLQGHEFKADRASLAVQEVGISYDFRDLAEKHVAFFRRAENTRKLRELVAPEDEGRDIRLKMIAILAGTGVEVDGMLLKFLAKAAAEPLVDPVSECLESAELDGFFWAEVQQLFGYGPAEPTFRDFVVTLFRGADPFDHQVQLQPHARVFLQRWKDSQAHRKSYQLWSHKMEGELQVASRLDEVRAPQELGDADTFEAFEKFTIRKVRDAFQGGADPGELLRWLAGRRQSFWYPPHEHGYAALERAVELRELLGGAELEVDTFEAGISRYMTGWWKIDRAYRAFCWHLREYAQVGVMEPVARWVEGSYVNNFLLPLSDRWSDRVAELDEWRCQRLPRQASFFDTYVRPFIDREQKVFVIVSDGLRYEAAADFAARLLSESRWTTKLEALLGSVPSYTQIGMASLLPGGSLSLDPSDGRVTLGGKSTAGTESRKAVLREATGGKATAIQAEQFLDLNTKTEGRALMREHQVIYILHDVIDKAGDIPSTEARTPESVERCFQELFQICKKVANINGSNIILTTDHGFLFQLGDLDRGDDMPLPVAEEWTYRNRRFAIGRGIRPDPSVTVFSADQIGLKGDWSVAFPKSIGRFPLQGSGKRYVHGGLSLQEVIIPVVKIHKSRTEDTRRVEVELMRIPAKVTTGQVALAVYQTEPVSAKVLPRELRIGIFAPDGTGLSEVKATQFDSDDPEPRNRETHYVLGLSASADEYNDQTVEVRLEETLPGTQQTVTYRSHPIKIQKPFASDFDDF